MYRHIIFIASIITGIICFFSSTLVLNSEVYADQFGSTIVRLERMKVSQSSYPILIIVEPSTLTSTRTETSIRFTLASSFSVNSTASNISTSTTNLPSVVQGHTLTAMPGLSSTATAVSGQQIDFSISNLTDGNYYAFYITSGITNPSAAGSYRYSLATRDSGNIDTSASTAEVDISSNDRITVSASVPAKTGEGSVSVAGVPTSGSYLHEGDGIDVTISYRSTASTSKSFTIIASWDKGTVVNTSSQVDVFDYVVGSATDAYGGAYGSVDTQNRKITWYISSLPPSTAYKTVTFKLKVRSDIPESSTLTTRVKADGSIQTAALSQSTLVYTIQHSTAPTGVHPSATPTPAQGAFGFEYIRLNEITNSSAQIAVRATENARVSLSYGLKPSQLTKTIKSIDLQRTTLIDLSDLLPDTPYYFRVTITNAAGKSRTSDIFVFRTALSSSLIKTGQLEIFWKQLLLSNGTQPVIMATGKPMTIKLHVDNPDDVNEIIVKIVKKGVLGINTFVKPVNEVETRLIQSITGEFIGELAAPHEAGEYQLIMSSSDVHGGFFTDILHKDIFVSEPITFINKQTGQPIESAATTIYVFSSVGQTYTPLDAAISYVPTTDTDGQLNLVLPVGRYKVDAEAIGYETNELAFTLDRNHYYPSIHMKPNMTLPTYAMYHYSGLSQLKKFVLMQMRNIAESPYARAGLRTVTGLLTIVLLLTYLFMRHAVEKSKKNEHVLLHEMFHVIVYSLFTTGIVITIAVFLIVLAFGGVLSSFPFFVLACFDIMLLDMIVVHVTHLRKMK